LEHLSVLDIKVFTGKGRASNFFYIGSIANGGQVWQKMGY
jgi:hypothetical protein